MLPCYAISKSAGALHQFLDDPLHASCNPISYFAFYNLIFIYHIEEFSEITSPLFIYILVIIQR